METNNPESQHNPGPEHIQKPPPIYIQDVTSMPPLLQLLEQVAAQQYETKTLADNQVKVLPFMCSNALKLTHAHCHVRAIEDVRKTLILVVR
jgi:hypothetical protein